MEKKFTDLTSVQKHDNDDIREVIESKGIPGDEVLTAGEFMDLVITPIKELQDDLEKNVVRTVKFNGQTVEMKEGGLVEFAQQSSTAVYGVILTSDTDSASPRIIKKGNALDVKIRYCAIVRSALGEESVYNDELGTLRIYRQMQNAPTAELVATKTGIRAVGRDGAFDVAVNLAEHARTGQQTIRLEFSTGYTVSGIRQTIQESITYSVNVIDLAINNYYSFTSPVNGDANKFPLLFNVSGNVKKWLHVRIEGATQHASYTNVYELDEAEGNLEVINIPDTDTYGLCLHGIHTITAWLTCDDGSNSLDSGQVPMAIESEHILNRVMVVNSSATQEEKSRVYLVAQNIVQRAENYAQTQIGQFAIWHGLPDDVTAPDTTPLNIKALVTDFTAETDKYTQTYGEINFIGCVPYQVYNINTVLEVESSDDTVKEFATYLRIFLEHDDGTLENMISASRLGGSTFGITVNNSSAYAPTSGATFYLNPKSRTNREDDWKTIKNARDNNAVVASTWSDNFTGINDGWSKDEDGIGVLRVLAGERIEITGDAIDAWGAFATNGTANMTIEIDCKVENVTNQDDPIISLMENDSTGNRLGFSLSPSQGLLACVGNQNEEKQHFRWREQKRTNIIITTNHAVDTQDDDIKRYRDSNGEGMRSYQSYPLARVYINGKCNRAFEYEASSKIWQTAKGSKKLVLGQAGADLLIYSIRIYDRALDSQQIKNNIVAAQPTIEAKDEIIHDNAIVDARGLIQKGLVENHLHRNTLTLHSASEIWKGIEGNSQNCYIEMHVYDQNTGEELYERGGTLCKQAYLAAIEGNLGGKACLTVKSQGSTANTYYWHNWQGKMKDCTYLIRILFSQLHADFDFKPKNSNDTTNSDGSVKKAKYPIYHKGEQIQGSEFEKLSDDQKAECEIEVPDGWVDWNGMYHGQFWKPSANGAKAQKLCNKINYASSPVSHKMGLTALYNDVTYKILGDNGLLPLTHQKGGSARFAVEELPFFYFHQDGESNNAYFHGFGTFGSAKGDKPTWGYDDEKYPRMCMFEGADNNVPLADFRVPFDEDIKPYYDDSKGDWSWAMDNRTTNLANELQFDFDLGLTKGDTKTNQTAEKIETDAPAATLTAELKKMVNFVYCHNTRIRPYFGSFNDLQTEYRGADAVRQEDMRKSQYWCTADFCLYRFNFTSLAWVEAGTWNHDTLTYTPGMRNLSTDAMTADVYNQWVAGNTLDFNILNKEFCKAIARDFAAKAVDIFCVKSILTHYNLINAMCAGTDNCSKNTYFVLCPILMNGAVEYRWYTFTDDVDTIFATDNNGQATKLWWIDRMHDFEDFKKGYKSHTDYEGSGSTFFNAIEDAFDDNLIRVDSVSGSATDESGNSLPLQANMRDVFDAMRALVSDRDKILGYNATSNVMACWHKYFLQYSLYFPIVAFNETGRIRYEYPWALHYRSRGKGARGISSIEQHMGDQRECECDYLERRTLLYAQYAAWGDAQSVSGATGVEEASGSYQVKGSTQLGSLSMQMTLKSNRPFYPTATSGNSLSNPHVRVMPGYSYHFDGPVTVGDQGAELCCSNFYTEFGNIGNFMLSNTSEHSIGGNRLKKIEIVPDADNASAFNPGSLQISAKNIEEIRFASKYSGDINLTGSPRLRKVDFEGSNVKAITLPAGAPIQSIKYGREMTSISVRGAKYLRELTAQDYSKVTSVEIVGCPNVNTLTIMSSIYANKQQGGTVPLTSLTMHDINWGDKPTNTGVSPSVIAYLMEIPELSLTGYVNVPNGSTISAQIKMALLDRFGSVDSPDDDLYITYPSVSVKSVGVVGDIRIRKPGDYKYSLTFSPVTANNFTALDWEIGETAYAGIVAETIHSSECTLRSTRIEDESVSQPQTDISCTVRTLTGSFMAKMQIYLYNRIPKLGDWAYCDGEFDSVLYPYRDVVGWVYKVDEIEPDTQGRRRFECHVQSGERLNFMGSNGFNINNATGNQTSTVWGIYAGTDTNNMPWSVINEIMNAVNTAVPDTFASNTEVGDIRSLQNFGTSASGFVSSGSGNPRISNENGYDLTTSDGFKAFQSTQVPYAWNGKENTLKIVEHAKNIIEYYVPYMSDADNRTVADVLGKAVDIPQTVAELVDLALAIRTIGGGARYVQLVYPAAFGCYLYEPQTEQGLHEQYRKNHWYLPACADLYRLFIFDRNSRCSDPRNTSSLNLAQTASVAYAKDGPDRPEYDALVPAYANLLQRTQNAGVDTCPVAMNSRAFTWSSNEGGSTTAWTISFDNGTFYGGGNGKGTNFEVRPVATFVFVL